jgi:glycosyltransferase involved in cell wall biosynthesis
VNAGSGGAGGATATGLAYAQQQGYEYVVTIDADGQHTSEDCLKVLAKLQENKADMVIGSRLINSAGMPWYRIIGNKGLSLLTYVMFGLYVTDSQSGLRGLNYKALHQILIRSQGMEFCSEMIWRAKQKNLRVLEIPIQAVYTTYSLAKGQRNWNAINIVRNLIKRKLLESINA